MDFYEVFARESHLYLQINVTVTVKSLEMLTPCIREGESISQIAEETPWVAVSHLLFVGSLWLLFSVALDPPPAVGGCCPFLVLFLTHGPPGFGQSSALSLFLSPASCPDFWQHYVSLLYFGFFLLVLTWIPVSWNIFCVPGFRSYQGTLLFNGHSPSSTIYFEAHVGVHYIRLLNPLGLGNGGMVIQWVGDSGLHSWKLGLHGAFKLPSFMLQCGKTRIFLSVTHKQRLRLVWFAKGNETGNRLWVFWL